MIDAAALAAAKRRFDLRAAVPGLALHSRTNGGEWHGPCPCCDGTDRFVAWPQHPGGTPLAWCRQCHETPMDPVAFLEWRDGCDFVTACARLGVRDADPPTVLPQHVATYSYLDAAGVLLYQVLRYEPKTFRQRRPDGMGGWIWKLGDVRRVLYRLPQLRAAPAQAVVWLVEGEKDAEALVARGEVATTNPGGARSWHADYAEHLRDRLVVVVPDADTDGALWQAAVCASLVGVARAVKVVAVPGGHKDVSDFLAAGGTVETLAARAGAGPRLDTAPDAPGPVPDAPAPRFQVLTDAESDAIPPPDWLVDGYVLAGAINVAHGEGGAGKSLACLDLALTLASGGTLWQGVPCRPGPVVYLAAEGPEETSQRKRAWKATFHPTAIPDFYLVPDTVPFLDGTAIPDLLALLPPDLRPALIVVDTLARIMGADGNENETQDMSAFVAACDILRKATGAAVLVIHHDNRAGSIRGSMVLMQASRNSLKCGNDDTVITLESDKHNNSGKQPAIRLALRPVPDPNHPEKSTVVVSLAAPEDRDTGRPLNDREQQILAALCEPVFQHGANLSEIRDATRLENWQIFRGLNVLVKRGLAVESGIRKTPTRRHKATAAGYRLLDLAVPWAPLLGGVTDSDTAFAPSIGRMDADEHPDPAVPVTASDTPPALDYARMSTSDSGVTVDEHPMSTAAERVTDSSTPLNKGATVSHSASAEELDVDPPPDPAVVPPVWTDPPTDAPPAPQHLGTCGHHAISIAWDAGPPGRWRCRSCWALHRM